MSNGGYFWPVYPSQPSHLESFVRPVVSLSGPIVKVPLCVYQINSGKDCKVKVVDPQGRTVFEFPLEKLYKEGNLLIENPSEGEYHVEIIEIQDPSERLDLPFRIESPKILDFIGSWQNQSIGGIARVVISTIYDELYVHIWSKRSPKAGYWGKITKKASDADNDVLELKWEHQVGESTQRLTYSSDNNGEYLHVTTDDVYSDTTTARYEDTLIKEIALEKMS